MKRFNDSLFNRKAGFSLVELLVVVAVIMIVASISAPIGTVVFYREKEILLRKNLSKIRKAIDDYYEYTKGQYRLLEDEMLASEYIKGDSEYPDGTRYSSDEYWDWKFYPSSWQELYLNNFLKPEDTVNPFTGVKEDFDIVIAVPLEYMQQRRLNKEYGVDKTVCFNLPKYPDGIAPASPANPFDLETIAASLGLGSTGLLFYIIEPSIPDLKDKNGNTIIKYVFSKKEWYTYFVDQKTGMSKVFESTADSRIKETPITYPFKISGSNISSQMPYHSPRIFDVRYPKHDVSLDGYTYYDQW